MTELVRPQKAGHWSEAALRVLHERYLKRTGEGAQETPEELKRYEPLVERLLVTL